MKKSEFNQIHCESCGVPLKEIIYRDFWDEPLCFTCFVEGALNRAKHRRLLEGDKEK